VPRVRRSERESTPTAAPFAIVCSGDMATRLARQTWCGRLGAADLVRQTWPPSESALRGLVGLVPSGDLARRVPGRAWD
jgi:hypothetical protein